MADLVLPPMRLIDTWLPEWTGSMQMMTSRDRSARLFQLFSISQKKAEERKGMKREVKREVK